LEQGWCFGEPFGLGVRDLIGVAQRDLRKVFIADASRRAGGRRSDFSTLLEKFAITGVPSRRKRSVTERILSDRPKICGGEAG